MQLRLGFRLIISIEFYLFYFFSIFQLMHLQVLSWENIQSNPWANPLFQRKKAKRPLMKLWPLLWPQFRPHWPQFWWNPNLILLSKIWLKSWVHLVKIWPRVWKNPVHSKKRKVLPIRLQRKNSISRKNYDFNFSLWNTSLHFFSWNVLSSIHAN